MNTAYAEATGTGSNTVVLNFEGAEYINSTGIALIVALLAQARANQVEVKAFGLSDHYREIFEITRLADFMTIADDEQRAVSGRRREAVMPEAATTFDARALRGEARAIDIKGDITAQSEDVLMDAYGRASGEGVKAIVLNFTARVHEQWWHRAARHAARARPAPRPACSPTA